MQKTFITSNLQKQILQKGNTQSELKDFTLAYNVK